MHRKKIIASILFLYALGHGIPMYTHSTEVKKPASTLKRKCTSLAAFFIPAALSFAYLQRIKPETMQLQAGNFLKTYSARGLVAKIALTHGPMVMGIPFSPISEMYLVSTLSPTELRQYKLFMSCIMSAVVGAVGFALYKVYKELSHTPET